MDLLLIISIIYMYYMTKNYNQRAWFKIYIVDILVQIFHIIILFIILRNLFIYGTVLPYLFLPLHLWGTFNNIRCLILNINGELDDNEDEENEGENDNEDTEEW